MFARKKAFVVETHYDANRAIVTTCTQVVGAIKFVVLTMDLKKFDAAASSKNLQETKWLSQKKSQFKKKDVSPLVSHLHFVENAV